MKLNIEAKFLFVLLLLNGKLHIDIFATTQNHDTFSFLCQNQIVKVKSNTYHLDRLTASLKSEYFEKLFTSDDFKRKNYPILEIQPINSEVFPAILDIIHGTGLHDILNKDNYLSLLKEMNYLGMEIDLESFGSFIDCDLKSYSLQDSKILELYNFIRQNSKFEYLLQSVSKYLSNHLDALQNHTAPSFDHIIQIIGKLECLNEETKHHVLPLCSKLLKLDPKIFETPNSLSHDEYVTENSWGEIHVNDRKDRIKLNEFRKNGDLYDITLRVGEKIYKLHRRVLESKSSYFRDIFRAEYAKAIAQYGGTPTTFPSKDKEYLLSDEIDPLAFEEVITTLYEYNNFYEVLKKFEYKWYKIEQFLKIIHVLRNDDLLENCISSLTKEYRAFIWQDADQILNFIHGKSEYEDLYIIVLSEHLDEKWPNIYNVSQFCSISWTVLEKMLKPSRFHFHDPRKIFEICSKWASYDVNGRYQFLPQIARIVNPLCVVKNDTCTAEVLADLNNQSEQFARDELWKILSSFLYTIRSESDAKSWSKLEEIPVFIVGKSEKSAVILNADLDVITSINNNSECTCFFGRLKNIWDAVTLSTTQINNNLFIFTNFEYPFTFQVYNLLTKKCIQLSCDLPERGRVHIPHHYYTLLNCNNDIYICSNLGLTAKYSIQFNIWTILSEHSYEEGLRYTSDGKKLYRMYDVSRKIVDSGYTVEEYNLENNLWSRVPGSPLMKNVIPKPVQLSMVNDRDFIALSCEKIIISHRDPLCKEWHWNYHDIPRGSRGEYRCFCSPVFAQFEDRLLLLISDEFYRYYPSNGSFELKKKLSKRFFGISAIDRHKCISA